jgi:multidrug transporter EmrE-like cation transporter
MIPASTMIGYLMVSLLWGCTNPFIKHAQVKAATSAESAAVNSDKTDHSVLVASSTPISVATAGQLSHIHPNTSTTNTATQLDRPPLSGIKKITGDSIYITLKRFVQDLNVLVPWMLNQLGSVGFFVLLSTEPVSIASPVVNSLTFLFTAITSYMVFNERVRHFWLLLLGTVLIVAGTALCMM